MAIGDDDPLGSFVFRTTGYNSIRTLAARLHYFQAVSGNRLASLPLELRLRGKSTRQSHGSPIYFVDITVRDGMTIDEALTEARRVEQERQASGFDQAALETVARQGFGNGAFEDSEEEAETVVEEFFPETGGSEAGEGVAEGGDAGTDAVTTSGKATQTLAEKLATKVALQAGEQP